MQLKTLKRYPMAFPVFYFLHFFAGAALSIYLPLFFKKLGYSNTEIGMLASIEPFVAMPSQALWGIIADRARNKLNIIRLLLVLAAIVVLPIPYLRGFGVMLLALGVLSVFNSSIGPISDAFTLESLDASGWSFGPIRLAGTLGWTVSSLVAGSFAEKSESNIFYVFAIVFALAVLCSFFIPKNSADKAEKERIPIKLLFANRELLILIFLHFLTTIPLVFYANFFQLYYQEMGASFSNIKWAIFIATASEIPFLLFGKGIIRRFGVQKTLVFSTFVYALRWLILFFVKNIYLVMGLQLIHGLTYIVFSYTIAMFINQVVPSGLKASGQALSAIIVYGFGHITGGLLGGWLGDIFSLRTVFLLYSILSFAIVIMFQLYLGRVKINREQKT